MSPNDLSFPSSPSAMPARNLRFFNADIAHRWYMDGDPVRSAFFTALSATFPLGERFFIDSVREWRGVVDPSRHAEVDAFVVQEALHTREHLVYNDLIAAAGYDTSAMTDRTRDVLAPSRAGSALGRLGLTMALEHFTALFAHAVLTRPELLAGAPEDVRSLWRWHAMEEIEHKAVAFDVFVNVTASWPSYRRYGFRVWTLVEASRVLGAVVARNMGDLYAQDGLSQSRTWWKTLRFFFGWHGVVTRLLGGYAAWLRPGFHPWQIDDLELAQQVAAEIDASRDPTLAEDGV